MFDSIGRTNDAEAAQRSVAALGMSAAMLGSALLIGFAVAAWTAKAVIEDAFEEDRVLIVMEEVEEFDAELPPPPPPPPPAGADEPEEEQDEPDPDEMDEEVVDLDDQVDKEVATEARPAGVEGGVEGGVKDGQIGGVAGGDPDGELGGQLGGARTFHHSEVRVKRRTALRYPETAYDLKLGEVACKVRVFIDEEGVPYNVLTEACPPVFHDEVKDGLSNWRWYPAKVRRDAVKAQFLMVVRFIP